MEKEKIVLCGSMKVKDKILEVASKLESMGYDVLLPKECMEGLPKEIASFKHFERIEKRADKVLIVNEYAHKMPNYIGPNSFAEIAFAFYFKKPTYLLNDYYSPYMDELEGWHVNKLDGDITKLTLTK